MAMTTPKPQLPAALQAQVDAKVNAIEGLTATQREALRTMSSAYILTHPKQEPSYEGLARHVRSTVQ